MAKSSNHIQTAFRLSRTLLSDLDKVVDWYNRDNPYPRKTRADLVRMLIEEFVKTAKDKGVIK